jgi:hypothetical protein
VLRSHIFLNAEDARMQEAMGNVPDGREVDLVTPASNDEHWFVIFDYNEVGHIKDDEKDKIDANALLGSIREGTEEANKVRVKVGASAIHAVGWQQPRKYDDRTHNLTWAIIGQDDEGGRVVNFNVRLLGRKGVIFGHPGRRRDEHRRRPATPRPHPRLSPAHRQALGFEGRIRAAARCDGRLPDETPAGPAEVARFAADLRANGPTPGTPHYSTCILIYDAILDGLAREETRKRLLAWVRDVAPRGSRDARERLGEALADTERLVAFYFRPRRRRPPGDAGPRRKPPSRLRRGDLVRLQSRFGREGGRAVSLAGRILEHVKANGLRIAGTNGYYCELPVVPLGITSDVERRTRDLLRGQGLLRPTRPAIAKLDDDHPLGPRAAKPALWRVHWAFADTRALLPPMSALFPRRPKGQVADFPAHEPRHRRKCLW